jgi:uncharacterized OB-fold protein
MAMDPHATTDQSVGITVGRCSNCATTTVPVPEFCPTCLSSDVAGEQHDSDGVVYAATVVRRGPKGVDLPFGLAYIDLTDTLRIMSRYTVDGERLAPGTRVTVSENIGPAGVPLFEAAPAAGRGAAL